MGCKFVIDAPKEWPTPPPQQGATIKIQAVYKADNQVGGGAFVEPVVNVDYEDGRKHEIHGLTGSPNAVGPAMFALLVFGDECEFKVCDLMSGAQMEPAFIEMNPFHTIPTFKNKDGTSLGESNTILRYIARRYAPEYYPMGKRHIIDWAMDLRSMKIYNEHNTNDFAHLVYPIFGYMPGRPAEEMEGRVKAFSENVQTYEDLFLKEKFIAGNSVTIADFALAPMIKFIAHPHFETLTGFKCSERLVTYLADFEKAVPTASMLNDAGGWSIQEMFDSKMKENKEAE